MITPLVGSDPQIFAGSLPPTQQKTRWSAAIPKYSWSYLKDCSNHEKRRQHWSAVILKYLDILGTNTCRITATRQNHQTNTTVIMITPLVGSDPQIFEHFSTKYLQDHCHQLKKKQWSTAIPKYSSSYLKDCSKHEKTDTTGRQWSSNIWAFPYQIFAGSLPPRKNQKNTTVISSNPQIFMSHFWHELFEGLQKPCE